MNKTCQCQLCWTMDVAEGTNRYMASQFPPGWRRIESRLACADCWASYVKWMQSRLALASTAVSEKAGES